LKNKIIDDLTKQVNSLKSKVVALTDENDQLKKQDDDGFLECPVIVNLDQFEIFSIERIPERDKLNMEKTVITVVLPKSEDTNSDMILKEWFFNIGREAHNELVERFAKYLQNRNVKYISTGENVND
jgi:hypothetical protein